MSQPSLALMSAAALTFIASPVLGVTIRDDRTTAQYVAYAQNTQGVQAVGDFNIRGGGTLIAPRFVLTAAHIGTPSSFRLDGQTRTVIRATVFPGDPSRSDATDGFDLQIVELDNPINTIAPAPLYTGAISDAVGLLGSYAGSGATGTGTTGATITNNTVLGGTNFLDAAGLTITDGSGNSTTFSDRILFSDFDDPDVPLFGGDNENFLGDPGATDLEMGLAGGDSGGGLFIENNGRFELLAVHSFVLNRGTSALGEYGDGNASTAFQTPEQLEFIRSTIPEPTTALLLLPALTGLMARRSGRSGRRKGARG